MDLSKKRLKGSPVLSLFGNERKLFEGTAHVLVFGKLGEAFEIEATEIRKILQTEMSVCKIIDGGREEGLVEVDRVAAQRVEEGNGACVILFR